MEKFNLERALTGEPVVTRDGREVTEIHFFKTYQGDYPLIAVIDENQEAFTKDGFFASSREECESDLFMKPKVVEGWFNVYVSLSNQIFISHTYSSEEKAKSSIIEPSAYIKTIKITNEMK